MDAITLARDLDAVRSDLARANTDADLARAAMAAQLAEFDRVRRTLGALVVRVDVLVREHEGVVKERDTLRLRVAVLEAQIAKMTPQALLP